MELWFKFVEKKCDKNFVEHFRSNERNLKLTRRNEYCRRDRLSSLIEQNETLTIDSDDLFQLFNQFYSERISLQTSFDEHRIQGEIYRQRIGAEIFRSLAFDFAKFYSLIRQSSSIVHCSFETFQNLLFENLSSVNSLHDNSSTHSFEHLSSLNDIRRRETYIRCFQSISTYLSSALNRFQYDILLVLLVFINENSLKDLQLFDLMINKFDPRESIFVPDYLDDPRRPTFVSKYSWTLLLNNEINDKFVHLNENLIENPTEWKEYLSSTNRIDFLNESPYERSKDIQLNLIDRFLLNVLLRSDRVRFNRIDFFIDRFFFFFFFFFKDQRNSSGIFDFSFWFVVK